MPHKVETVSEKGIAWRHGVRPGDLLIAMNGEPVIDDIDYQVLSSRAKVILTLETDGVQRNVTVVKPREAPLGMTLGETFALTPRTCKNHCVFCFIDQMPRGMRRTLYVKDDDWRLSLMMGNFVTLTNVDEEEFERIIKRKASPLYISVHATDPDVRTAMMRNPDADQLMPRLLRLRDAGICFHCQIVLCPGINDGAVLDRTLADLSALYPAARSAALVPVGLTKCREHLTSLSTYSQSGAQDILSQAASWQEKCLETLGTRFVFPSDEFYCQAQADIPSEEQYEGYPQIENGVGLLRQFEESMKERARESHGMARGRNVLIVCGTSLEKTMNEWVRKYAPPFPDGFSISVKAVRNHFFGETVTVTGLLTGGDIAAQTLKENADEILISANTLRAEGDLFLDDMSLDTLRQQLLPKQVTVVQNNGAALYEALLG